MIGLGVSWHFGNGSVCTDNDLVSLLEGKKGASNLLLYFHFNKVLFVKEIRTLVQGVTLDLFLCIFPSLITFITILCFLYRPQLLKNALQRAVERGQLEQITGKGASGTFQVRGQKCLVIVKWSQKLWFQDLLML